MITDIEDYFTKGCGRCARFDTPDCSTRKWAQGLAELRRICLSEGLTETVKWGHPCYMHSGRNIAIFGAFRDNFRLTFMNARLLGDPAAILKTAGPNSRTAGTIRFDEDAGPSMLESILRGYLKEAIGYAIAGTTPPKQITNDRALADELITAMDVDPLLAEAFHALTPGRQRGWNLHFSSAKQSATRTARIEKALPKILAGKGWNER